MRLTIAVDGSPQSLAAVEFISTRRFPASLALEITLLAVIRPIPPIAAASAGEAALARYYAEEFAAATAAAGTLLDEAGLAHTVLRRIGEPADEIAAFAAQEASDLIVMGSHGRTARAGVLLGSVATGVLAACKTPVLLLRQAVGAPPADLRVALAWDDSPDAHSALRFLTEHQEFFGARPAVTVLHVADPDAPDDTPLRAADAALAEPLAALRRAAIDHQAQTLRDAQQGDAIARFALESGIDLLLMGSHGRTRLATLVLGSVAARVGARCLTPLLLARAP